VPPLLIKQSMPTLVQNKPFNQCKTRISSVFRKSKVWIFVSQFLLRLKNEHRPISSLSLTLSGLVSAKSVI
jgi:hypothetical protein